MIDPIHIFPNTGARALEWSIITKKWQHYAYGKLAKDAIATFLPSFSKATITNDYILVQSILKKMTEGRPLPMSEYEDIRAALELLKTEGYVLSIEEIRAVDQQIRIGKLLNQFSAGLQNGEKSLKAFIDQVDFPTNLYEKLQTIFDEHFEIKRNASKELERIAGQIDTTRQKLNTAFGAEVRKYKEAGYLAETKETIRNGRRVLSVKAEFKRQIQGILHDESSSGKVVYLEPQSIVKINNELFDLEQEKRREIFRILKDLCRLIRQESDLLRAQQDHILQLDLLQSRARFGRALNGVCPPVEDQSGIKIQQGKHPLLVLDETQEVVPFDCKMSDPIRLTLVSGPNAGGKTVLMKAIGLLQMMVQASIPVPVEDGSEFGIFHRFCIDIGDQQSIQDDLSTYSSHLQNMKQFLEQADERTLLLIDEMGTGTDPRLGGAIAEAILHALVQQGVHGMVTTHYSNLKNYANKQAAIMNGAMLFDPGQLRPTYEFRPGKAGSSFAFELAEQSGLPKSIIQQARKNAGNAAVNVDKMLSDLQSEKAKLEKRARAIQGKAERADQMMAMYDQMKRDLEAQRKRLKMTAKEYDIEKNIKIERALNAFIDKLRKQEIQLKEGEEKRAQIKREREQQMKDLQKMEEDQWLESRAGKRPLQVGDFVKLRASGTSGEIVRLEKNKAVIATGQFQIEAKLKDLAPIQSPIRIQKKKSVQIDSSSRSQGQVKSKLDIRGLPGKEADRLLEKYFDQVLVQGLTRIQIIHGKGSGVLRDIVRKKAESTRGFENYQQGADEDGGDGVTWIHL